MQKPKGNTKMVIDGDVFAALNEARHILHAIKRGDGLYNVELIEGVQIYAFGDPNGFEY
jgi:hypothetical protein